MKKFKAPFSVVFFSDKIFPFYTGVEDALAERTQQLQATEDKLNALNKAKNKTEGVLKENEFNLQKEKDAKAKLEKEKSYENFFL